MRDRAEKAMDGDGGVDDVDVEQMDLLEGMAFPHGKTVAQRSRLETLESVGRVVARHAGVDVVGPVCLPWDPWAVAVVGQD